MKTPEEKILKDYNRYIQTVASRFGQPKYLDDLIQIGRIAALQAHSRLDNNKIKNDEKSYITTCIKGSMKNFLTENARTIKIPAKKQGEVHISTISISTPVGDEGSTVEDFIVESEPSTPKEPNEALKKALMTLNEKERMVLEMHLDLNDESEPMTLKAVGDIMGVTRERARQIYQGAITKLQSQLGAEIKSNKLTHSTTWYERNKKQLK